MFNHLKQRSSLVISVLLALTLTGCGTIMYPERKGQTGGRIDPGVAILDGVGLLVFLVPGIVAFAVDFSNGTIYLPGGHRAHLTANELQQLKEGDLAKAELASRISQRKVVGRDVVVQPATDVARVEQFVDGYGKSKTVHEG